MIDVVRYEGLDLNIRDNRNDFKDKLLTNKYSPHEIMILQI